MTDWDLTPGEALAQLMMWEYLCTVMAGRILDPRAGQYRREADTHLFATAVRQVERFARLVRVVSPEPASTKIDSALAAFKKAAPDAVIVRNVLDHLDDYLRGVGMTYPAGPPEQYRTELISLFRPTLIWHEHNPDNHRMMIMPKPGEMLSLDLKRDLAAVSALGGAVREAVEEVISS